MERMFAAMAKWEEVDSVLYSSGALVISRVIRDIANILYKPFKYCKNKIGNSIINLRKYIS